MSICARYRRWPGLLTLAALVGFTGTAGAQVHYEKGRAMIAGVQLLQGYHDSLAYYYLPQVPRLSTNSVGGLQGGALVSVTGQLALVDALDEVTRDAGRERR